MYLVDINIAQWPASSCSLLQTILIPAHGLSSRTLKSAGSRYVLWAMCHLVPPAHPNRWWNKGAEAITIKAEDMAGLVAGLAALGKAKSVAWFLVKGRRCSLADSCHARAMLAYGGRKGYQQAKRRLLWAGGMCLCPQMVPSTLNLSSEMLAQMRVAASQTGPGPDPIKIPELFSDTRHLCLLRRLG